VNLRGNQRAQEILYSCSWWSIDSRKGAAATMEAFNKVTNANSKAVFASDGQSSWKEFKDKAAKKAKGSGGAVAGYSRTRHTPFFPKLGGKFIGLPVARRVDSHVVLYNWYSHMGSVKKL
jgi:hypothetical protein